MENKMNNREMNEEDLFLKELKIQNNQTHKNTKQTNQNFVHIKDVIHRNLRPATILVADFNKASIKITDFGLSAEKANRKEVTEFITASPSYQVCLFV